MTRKQIALITIFAVLIVDQISKFIIKTNFQIGDEINVLGNWFLLHFVENNGMAFGYEFGFMGKYGKVFLTVFRIIAVSGIGYILFKSLKKEMPTGVVISGALILAGAIGNIIDSLFYGMIFTDSMGRVAELFPASGGYASFMHGRVVDMLYFPMFSGTYPSWFPFSAGQPFLFFRPVFNIADSSISVGIGILLIFHRNYFNDNKIEEAEDIEQKKSE